MPDPTDLGAPPPHRPAPTSLPLLTRITQQSMDEDYLHVAERRVLAGTGAGQRPPARRSHRTAAVVLAAFGVLVTTAAVQTSRNADVDDASRSTLLARIEQQRDRVAGQQEQILELRETTTTLEQQSVELAAAEGAAENELRRLRVRTGFVAVEGPGVRLVVDDPPQGDERIRKSDLFLLVNALWSAGAEAVALNGHRLSVLTSINNSNVAINVDDDPLIPPYTLLAIGDRRTLAADVIDTSTFGRFDQLQRQYGFRFEMQDEASIELPAARTGPLRHAERVPDDRTEEEVDP